MPRKTVEFDDQTDSGSVQSYKERIAAARQRGGVPVGGAEPVQNLPNIVEAQEQARAGREMPEQERAYNPDEYRKMIESGQGVHGIGGAVPANQKVSTGEAPKPSVLSSETQEGLSAMLTENEGDKSDEPTDSGEDDKKAAVDQDIFKLLMGQQTDVLQRDERRKAIEARVEEIDLRHVLVGKGCSQVVPIIPDVFEVTYRQLNAREDIFSKRKAWEITREEAGENTSQAYYDTVLSLVNVVLSLTHINDEEMPDHRTESGDVEEKVFDTKFDDLLMRPFIVLQDLWINFSWFDDRVRQKLNVESLGNG